MSLRSLFNRNKRIQDNLQQGQMSEELVDIYPPFDKDNSTVTFINKTIPSSGEKEQVRRWQEEKTLEEAARSGRLRPEGF